MRDLTIVPTGVANVASVRTAFERLACRVAVSRDRQRVTDASYVVVPGVGTFEATVEALRSAGLVEPLRNRFETDRATLMVCAGHQILAASSEESPGIAGLGLVAEPVTRLATALPIPQLAWNRIEAPPAPTLLAPGWAYFANSYALKSPPAGWDIAWVDYGERSVAAMQRGRWLSCQFHPELSGDWGMALECR